ncbi:MAG: hypothetical protein Q7S27_02985 [Nanoarchaeota archaeon]|nr:hypothetical protein [Nanoarchaeota archaeon]
MENKTISNGALEMLLELVNNEATIGKTRGFYEELVNMRYITSEKGKIVLTEEGRQIAEKVYQFGKDLIYYTKKD